MNVVRMVLEGDLGQAEKLIAIALVLGVPVTGIGLSGKTLQRHEARAREFVEQLPALVIEPMRRGPPRESSGLGCYPSYRTPSDALATP